MISCLMDVMDDKKGITVEISDVYHSYKAIGDWRLAVRQAPWIHNV